MKEDALIKGSCLCGSVQYGFGKSMGLFQYCHCSRCRKFTGSVHGANVFVKPEQFQWLSGTEYISRFEPIDTKYFTTAFCKQCGSSLPWKNKLGSIVVVPVGTLDDDPQVKPNWNIYCASQADWYTSSDAIPSFDELPPKSSK